MRAVAINMTIFALIPVLSAAVLLNTARNPVEPTPRTFTLFAR